jgi:hypothetical protein
MARRASSSSRAITWLEIVMLIREGHANSCNRLKGLCTFPGRAGRVQGIPIDPSDFLEMSSSCIKNQFP